MSGTLRPCSAFLRADALRHYVRQPSSHRHHLRFFHWTRRRDVIKPFLLADIGEGIRECQIIQWFIQPGARVEQFDKLCEVQSDKAAVEITSPFDGVIKELHYEPDDMAIVGKPLLDIDIQSEITPEDEAKLATDTTSTTLEVTPSKTETADRVSTSTQPHQRENKDVGVSEKEEIGGPLGRHGDNAKEEERRSPQINNKHQTLATPAVRHLTKEYNIDIADIRGSGKDGRVLKEDVHRHVSQTNTATPTPSPSATTSSRTVPLTPVQSAMFKTMTRSLSIPHFLYTTPTDFTSLTKLRTKINNHRTKSSSVALTPLPFILKAVSMALAHHPLLNASLDTTSDLKTPALTFHTTHNFGIAVDTPSGLLVPVVKNVQDLSVSAIAARIRTLSAKAREGKLSQDEMHGASFTISNIGSVGGGVVAPVIVAPQVAILGVGRARTVPAFAEDGGADDHYNGGGGLGARLVKKEECVFSWSADHRVVDGAECARAAERVREYLESVEGWIVDLK